MSKVRSSNTAPEIITRSIIHKMGYRFRLHNKKLPGNPDIVLPRHKKIIFIQGCFWHQHEGCTASNRPTSNKNYWDRKLDRTVQRDKENQILLKNMDWSVLVLWECLIKNRELTLEILTEFLGDKKCILSEIQR